MRCGSVRLSRSTWCVGALREFLLHSSRPFKGCKLLRLSLRPIRHIVRLFSEYLTVYMCVSSIQNLSCVMCVFSCVSVLVCVCWCLCHQITVLFVCVCFNACVCRDGIFQKNWKWKQTRTNKHTHDTTKINIAPARARMTRTNREKCTIFDIFCWNFG